jgi:hypothetical protein
VDDLLIFADDTKDIDDLKREIRLKFKIKELGPAKWILGIEIKRDRTHKLISLSQEKYIDSMLERFNMTDAHDKDTPGDPSIKLGKDGQIFSFELEMG